MFSRNFIALASLLSSLVIQVDAGSLIPKAAVTGGFTGSFGPKVISGDFEIQSSATPSRISPIGTSAQTSIAPFPPTAENLIFNTTVPQGEPALLGWIFSGTFDGSIVFDRFARNITVFYTPPAGTEQFVFSLFNIPPDIGFCGFFPGVFFAGILDSNDLGTYNARWIVEFGQSTQPDVPVDPHSGCGPVPFDSTTVEFERSWEVVEAE
ncbi:hypothetical protein C8J57DRAFT_1223346 [Mycena rebaudengoi]|nr:hypothetical protein C8J57DRAFT_1223346 [Mycena rebaudengoi]